MTRSITGTGRSGVLLAGGAAAVALLLSGCGAGQLAETAGMAPAVPGVNQQVPAKGTDGTVIEGSFSVRNAVVSFRAGGYAKGESAPLDVRIFNDTATPALVRVSSPDAESVVLAGRAGDNGNAVPAEVTPDQPAGTPAEVRILAKDFAALSPADARFLQLVGLKKELKTGDSVTVIFDFGNDVRIEVAVPVSVPLTPQPRATGHVAGEPEHS